jgi:ATP-dependent helicase/nuclease subunit A
VVGIVDLLLETDEGVVIVDHKTFPGGTEASWRKKALEVAGQLFVYAHVLRQAGRKVLGLWVHLPHGRWDGGAGGAVAS